MSLNLFVYGTLKQGERSHYLLQGGSEILQPINPPGTFVKGHLFDGGPFPVAWIPGDVRLANAQTYEFDQWEQKEQEAKAKGVIAESNPSVIGQDIFGEIYQVDEGLLGPIDHYEAVGRLFQRVLTFAYLPSEGGGFSKLPVWAYTIMDRRDTLRLQRIPSGKWILLGVIQ